MPPNPVNLLKRIGLTTPLIGFYDAPDAFWQRPETWHPSPADNR